MDLTCKNCGNAVHPYWNVCPICGTNVEEKDQSITSIPPPARKKSIYSKLWVKILFLIILLPILAVLIFTIIWMIFNLS